MTTTTAVAPGLSLLGHAVFDCEGTELGEVRALYLDNTSRQPEWAALGRVGGEISIVPLAGADIYEDSIDVPFTRGQVDGAPYRRTRLARELSEAEEAELYRHYDLGGARPTSTPGERASVRAPDVLEGLQGFARRSPWLFLVSAAAVGFAAGRAIRAARAYGRDQRRQEGVAGNELDAATVDALSRRLWPGELADEGSPAPMGER